MYFNFCIEKSLLLLIFFFRGSLSHSDLQRDSGTQQQGKNEMYYHKIGNFNEAWISEPWRRVGLGKAKIILVPLREL